jgi:uncharacterized repeat protein (TIGR01451 family)
LTHDNTASAIAGPATGSDTVSIPVVQNPHVTLDKAASVPGGTADAAGEVISYTIDVTNDGNMTLTDPMVSDLSVSHLAAVTSGGFNTGDTNADGELDLGETWHYTADHTVTQDEMDAGGSIHNTASVTTHQGATASDSASINIEQHPSLTLAKAASVPGGTADTVGETISYTIDVANNGNVTLTNPVVTDPSVSNLAPVTSGGFNSGDADHDGKIDVGETWHYTASHAVTAADLAGSSVNNTASVSTDQGASASGSASVPVTHTGTPHMTLTETALGYHDLNHNGVADVGDKIDFSFKVTNDGTATLNNINVSDPDGSVSVAVTGSTIVTLAPGSFDDTSFAGTHTINSVDVAAHAFNNSAVANSDEANAVTGTVHTPLAGLILLV